MNTYNTLEQMLNYHFKDINLLKTAMTHSSKTNEIGLTDQNHTLCNERLEFLGDSVLSLSVSDKIYKYMPAISEGDLSKIRAASVCEKTLNKCALALNLNEYLIMGKGEEITGGRRRPSILADAFEALIGAIYLDAGFDVARQFILSNLDVYIDKAIKGELYEDYKSELQNYVQGINNEKVNYTVVDEQGPDHDKTFTVSVTYQDISGLGTGKTKKEAEQEAARSLFLKIKG